MHLGWTVAVLVGCTPASKLVALPAGDLRVEVRVPLRPADETERAIAVPLETRLRGVAGVARVATTIEPERVTFTVGLADPSGALIAVPLVESRLAGYPATVSIETGDSYRMLDPELAAPEPPAISLMRVRRCDERFEVAIDPARLAAHGIAVEQLAAAIAGDAAPLVTAFDIARVPVAAVTVGDVAEVVARGCRTIGVRDPGRLVSLHGPSLAFQQAVLGSRLRIFALGANFEAVVDAPPGADRDARLARFTEAVAPRDGYAFLIDDSGPPRSTRLIARFVINSPTDDELAAHAAKYGFKVLGRQTEWYGDLGFAEATLTGPDRIAQARAALAALASHHAKDTFGCRGCDPAIAVDLDPARLGALHVAPPVAARAAAAATGGLAIARPVGDAAAIRIVLPAMEVDSAAIGALPVQNGVPLSAVARLRTAPHELERVDGKPALVVWLRGDAAERDLRDLLPNAAVAGRDFEVW